MFTCSVWSSCTYSSCLPLAPRITVPHSSGRPWIRTSALEYGECFPWSPAHRPCWASRISPELRGRHWESAGVTLEPKILIKEEVGLVFYLFDRLIVCLFLFVCICYWRNVDPLWSAMCFVLHVLYYHLMFIHCGNLGYLQDACFVLICAACCALISVGSRPWYKNVLH